MATEILRPQDALIGRFYGGLALDRNQQKRPSTKHERRKSNVAAAEVKKSQDGRRKGGLAMGQVTLLRRGESLASKIGDAIPRDPIQNIPPLKLVSDIYAGAGFDSSPSPRCLPLPSFSNMKGEAFEDDATKSLRRMLRLE